MAKLFALELISNTEKVRKRVQYYAITIESVLRGEVNKSLPYVQQHIRKYRAIIEYTEVMTASIRHLFSEDQEICEKLNFINTLASQ